MNKAQKRLVSALAAASSVAAVIAPAATVFAATKDEAAKLVAEAKKTLAFVDYNAAYAAVVALPEADQAALLAELSPLWEKVATADIMDVLKTMEDMAKTWDLENYYKVEKIINETVKLERNQQYLMGELTSWGKKAVFTADVVAATDAIIKAWTDKTPASIAAAKEAAAKVTNAGSLAWLNTELASVEAAAPLTVNSVTATTAKTFVIKFSKAVEDTTKVTFDVKRSSAAVALTASWNADKTEATLTNSANFSEGTYTVVVKNDTTDLGTSTVNITAQKIAKIEVTSSKLAVANVASGSGFKQEAYATYKVYDQYGADITGSYVANNITFQTGISTDITPKNGIITIKPLNGQSFNLGGTNQVVITGWDTTTGVSVTATLAVTTSVGTLNSVELVELTNKDGKVLTANDTSTLFYITYKATDMSDAATTNYSIIKNGLVLGTNDKLTTSSQYVEARVVQDPTDANKAAIEVKANPGTISMDMPVTITAMTTTGKVSTLNVTLKKQAALDTFTLVAPSFDIAIKETKEIPFLAYDQNGKQITKHSELKNEVTFSDTNRMNLVENVDGTAKLVVGSWTAKGPQIITAMTKSGKLSTLTLNIQDAVKADQLEVSNSKINYLTKNATQEYDFWDKGGLTAKDQFGRTMDMQSYNKYSYKVKANSNDTNVVTVAGTDPGAGTGKLTLTAVNPGTATITFELYESSNPTQIISTKTLTYTVVDAKDVVGYTIDAVSAPVYAAVARTVSGTALTDTVWTGSSTSGSIIATGTSIQNGLTSSSAITKAQEKYAANPSIYGLTSSGQKVKVGSGVAITASIDNTSDFLLINNNWNYGNPGAFDGVKVYAKDLDQNRTSASTNLTVTIKDLNDGSVKTVSTPITSSTVKPAAVSLDLKVKTQVEGVKVDGDTVYVMASSAAAIFTSGGFMTDYLGTTAAVRFQAKDQYGKDAAPISYFATSGIKGTNFSVAPNGEITMVTPVANDEITVTAITSNGVAKAVKIVFLNANDFNAK